MPTSYTIWQKIMLLPEEKLGAGTICVREGLDAGAACRKEKANPSGFKPPGQQDWQKFGSKQSADVEGIGPDYVSDDDKICEAFDRFVNPFCSFALPAPAKQMNQEIKQNGGWTIDFWCVHPSACFSRAERDSELRRRHGSCSEYITIWWVDAGGRPCLDPCFRWVDQLRGLQT